MNKKERFSLSYHSLSLKKKLFLAVVLIFSFYGIMTETLHIHPDSPYQETYYLNGVGGINSDNYLRLSSIKGKQVTVNLVEHSSETFHAGTSFPLIPKKGWLGSHYEGSVTLVSATPTSASFSVDISRTFSFYIWYTFLNLIASLLISYLVYVFLTGLQQLTISFHSYRRHRRKRKQKKKWTLISS